MIGLCLRDPICPFTPSGALEQSLVHFLRPFPAVCHHVLKRELSGKRERPFLHRIHNSALTRTARICRDLAVHVLPVVVISPVPAKGSAPGLPLWPGPLFPELHRLSAVAARRCWHCSGRSVLQVPVQIPDLLRTTTLQMSSWTVYDLLTSGLNRRNY